MRSFTYRIAFTLMLGAHPVSAQSPASPTETPRTLLTGRQVHGGFGGIDARITRLAGETAVLTGARGGWIVAHQLTVGVSAWWNATPGTTAGFRLPSGARTGLGFGYAGVELGWTTQPARLVHLTLGAMVGGGGANYYDRDARGGDFEQTPIDGFFVAEPALGVELNVSRHVRLVASGSYRAVAGARVESLRDRHLSGASGGLSLKFGKF